MTEVKHYARADGTYYGQSDIEPEGCIPTKDGPVDASCIWDGSHWISSSVPELSIEDLHRAAKADVDAAAEAYRLSYITGGSGQAMAYQQKLEEAQAYLDDPSLTAAECPHIYAEIGITGETADAVAVVVVDMHAAWKVKSAEIEHKRLAAKAAIDEAATAPAIKAAAKVRWEV